ncbi:MAG: sensory box histidine kinase/response regulator [Labilithrix sp.]|nr:sensory box histidine kinase/response regulator [Labilithrix sp.]
MSTLVVNDRFDRPIAGRLLWRLLAIQAATHVVAFLLSAVFAPRVLLLEPQSADASLSVIATMGLFSVTISAGLTVVVLRRVRSLLEALIVGSTAGDPIHVLALYDAPSILSLANVAFAGVVSIATLIPTLRPLAIDTYTQLALVLLVLTMVSTATLPAYVLMRSQVARTLELVSPRVAEEGLRRLGRGVLGRLRKRYVAAVALPVALVALGASLLADAHARAFDKEARARDAVDIAHAAFESLGTGSPEDVAGRTEAIEAAAALGFHVQIVPTHEGVDTLRQGDEGETQVTVPLQPGAALVRFGTTRLSAAFAAYAILAMAAVALAAILGTRAVASFDADIALATREIRRAGVAEVMRGTIILHEARFSTVAGLLEAIDALGGIFREFASAQRRAIDAREATERMRGLLLASMSHDLKAPLNAVLGFTELVRRNPLTKEQHESLAIIEQRGRELLVLIDTILDSARVEAGELEVSPEPTHVGDVVMSSVLEARDLSVGSEVQIMGEIQPGMPTLLIDGTRIVQALTAVVMTAARFSDKGIVPVRATLPDQGERLRIEVETSGEGLPVAEREKIFDAFKSAESARRQGGLGLGLQLARSIVEIHAGSIEVDNTAHGGMVFRVWLPVQNDRASIRARASRPTLAP